MALYAQQVRDVDKAGAIPISFLTFTSKLHGQDNSHARNVGPTHMEFRVPDSVCCYFNNIGFLHLWRINPY